MFIYKITNTLNGDFYIGKTIQSLSDRFRAHRNAKDECHLHRAMRKYGADNFVIELLEETTGDLEQLEIDYIKELSPHYNMTRGGDGGDTSDSPNYREGMKNRVHPHTPSFGMLGKTHPQKGKPLKANMCPVVCEGIEYESVGSAEIAYPGINLRKRLDDPRYPDFYRLSPRRVRKYYDE